MFGFFFGIACLIGLFLLLRRRHGYWHGYGGGWGNHGRWRHGHWGGRERRSWMLRWLFRHLDTTAGQEKVINSAAEDLEGRLREMTSELEQLRKEIGRSLRTPQFDGSAVRESFAKQRAHLDTLEESVIGHLGKIHEALDERQRGIFAELVQDGPRRSMRGCGHWRSQDPGGDDGRSAWRMA